MKRELKQAIANLTLLLKKIVNGLWYANFYTREWFEWHRDFLQNVTISILMEVIWTLIMRVRYLEYVALEWNINLIDKILFVIGLACIPILMFVIVILIINEIWQWWKAKCLRHERINRWREDG